MSSLITYFLIAILLLLVIFLDFRRKIDLSNKAVMSLYLIFVPHITILVYMFNQYSSTQQNAALWRYSLVAAILLITYLWLKVNILPHSKKLIDDFRIRVLMGSRRLILYGLYSSFGQIPVYYFAVRLVTKYTIPPYILVLDIIVTVLFVAALHTNGMLRVLITSRRLNTIKKIIIGSTMYIPVINILLIIYLASITKSEYRYEYYRIINRNIRIDSAICKTQYPLLMLHGVGFKDLKHINYWGRIPKELIRHGATIYYGNQEAWGTIEYNAEFLKNRVLEIVNQTGCQKVNIIAHSKGGLDARYMISKLEMGSYVASLTTISTPHRGSKIIDIIYCIPKGIFKALGNFIDWYIRLLGDKNPDVFTAVRQLSTDYCKEFNEEVKDSEQVYYQSYATLMNNIFSDYILTIPCFLLWLIDGKNDGLVSVESAKWGEFKGVLKNKYSRGISHGDIIDLRRNDYKGFDAREKFIEIVSDLKNRGY
ncbi:MAG: esterase/lipase family protein [Bacillota bacterium]